MVSPLRRYYDKHSGYEAVDDEISEFARWQLWGSGVGHSKRSLEFPVLSLHILRSHATEKKLVAMRMMTLRVRYPCIALHALYPSA